MSNLLEYYRLFWRRALSDIRSSVGKLQIGFLLVSGLVGALIFLFMQGLEAMKEETVSFVAYTLVPVAILAVLFILFHFITTPALIYKDQQREYRKALKQVEEKDQEIKKYLAGKPNIVFHSVQVEEQYWHSGIFMLNFWAVEADFRNMPLVPGESAIAKGVTAEIEVYDTEGNEVFPDKVQGLWRTDTLPHGIMPRSLTTIFSEEIDMTPSLLKYHLVLATKYPDDDNCAIFANESIDISRMDREKMLGTNPNAELEPGVYVLKVRLYGLSVDERFKFRLTNRGKDAMLAVDIILA